MGASLYLEISKTGASWLFRFNFAGKPKWMGLGSYHVDNTLAKMRIKVEEQKALIRSGIDPVQHRQKKTATFKKTVEASEKLKKKFEPCAKEYIELQRPKWKINKDGKCTTLASWNSTMEHYAYPIIGSVPVQDITIDHIIDILQPIWHTKTPTAEKVKDRLENILTYAKIKQYRAGENPAAWVGNLKAALPKPSEVHTEKPLASMAYEEVPDFFKQLYDTDTISAKALMLAILTGVRTAMVRFARPEHIKKGVWEVPEDLMKKGIKHRITLSTQALALIAEQTPVDGWLFPGQKRGKPISDGAMGHVRKELGRGDITVHGFRSSVRTWITEATKFRSEVGRKILSHKLTTDQTDASYDRSNLTVDRADALQIWADYCYSKID